MAVSPRQAARNIDQFRRNIRNFREPLRRSVQRVAIPSLAINFRVSGRPRWVPLKASTQRIRIELGFPPLPALIRTGRLARVSLSLQIWNINTQRAQIRNLPERVWYGQFIHQVGYAGNENVAPIPARPIFLWQEQDARAIERIFIDWIGEEFTRAWPPDA